MTTFLRTVVFGEIRFGMVVPLILTLSACAISRQPHGASLPPPPTPPQLANAEQWRLLAVGYSSALDQTLSVLRTIIIDTTSIRLLRDQSVRINSDLYGEAARDDNRSLDLIHRVRLMSLELSDCLAANGPYYSTYSELRGGNVELEVGCRVFQDLRQNNSLAATPSANAIDGRDSKRLIAEDARAVTQSLGDLFRRTEVNMRGS